MTTLTATPTRAHTRTTTPSSWQLRLGTYEHTRIQADFEHGMTLEQIASRHGLHPLQVARLLERLLDEPELDGDDAVKATWPDVDFTQITKREMGKIRKGENMPNQPIREAVYAYLDALQAAAAKNPGVTAESLSDLANRAGFDFSQVRRFLGCIPGAPQTKKTVLKDGTVVYRRYPARVAQTCAIEHARKLADVIGLDPRDIPGL